MDILDETRKHLVDFLKKVLSETYTQQELENFTVMTYQTPEFEKIRVEVCNMLLSSGNHSQDRHSAIHPSRVSALKEMIELLEHGQI